MRSFSDIIRAARRTSAPSVQVQRLVRQMCFELVPLKSVDLVIADLPVGAPVSVTCSPVKGIVATLELCARLIDRGHHVIPHIAARLVEGPEHTANLAWWVKQHGVTEVLIIGGDSLKPIYYVEALTFMRDFLNNDSGVQTVGFAAYPDGNALIDSQKLHKSIRAKQDLLDSAGVKGLVSTQMCFDAGKIRSWLRSERESGFTVPVNLGVPGVVDRTKLMTMGVRLGVGSSLHYLSKNKGSITRMFAPGGYDPTKLITDLAPDAEQLGIVGIHSFTFNNIADTASWQRAILESQ
ncbi:MAG: methylenetetrahydrofolate reductase [Ilumatobacteraceae bacterium]